MVYRTHAPSIYVCLFDQIFYTRNFIRIFKKNVKLMNDFLFRHLKVFNVIINYGGCDFEKSRLRSV